MIKRIVIAGCRDYCNYDEATKYNKPVKIKNIHRIHDD